MDQAHKTYFSWSSGKDAALALYYLLQDQQYQVGALLTSVNRFHERVSMHGLRRSLLERQVDAVNLPLHTLELPEQPSMEDYNRAMHVQLDAFRKDGYKYCGFGDIFLEDLRTYREQQLQKHGIKGVFPLWKKDTKTLIREWMKLGFKAVVITCKAELLDESFVGRELDETFLNDLPEGVDPCGENGEFHTFCYDGPIFSEPIPFQIGEKIYRAYKAPKKDEQHQNDQDMGFWFCDLLPD